MGRKELTYDAKGSFNPRNECSYGKNAYAYTIHSHMKPYDEQDEEKKKTLYH